MATATGTLNVQIVVTPGSGEGRAKGTARRLQAALSRRGHASQVRSFKDLPALAEWAKHHDGHSTHLVAVGGDATLSAAAAAALRCRVPFVPVPNGFGNIFARAFGHSDRAEQVVALLERGEVRAVDVGMVGDEIFLSHRSYGVLEQIQRTVERRGKQPRSRMLRHLAYYGVAKRLIFGTRLASISVEIDGRPVAERAILVTVANVETYRGFLSLTPSASPIDGLFDVFIVPRTTAVGLALRLLKLLVRSRSRWRDVIVRRADRVVVVVNGRRREELRVVRRALPLVVPPGSIELLERRTVDGDGAGAPAAA